MSNNSNMPFIKLWKKAKKKLDADQEDDDLFSEIRERQELSAPVPQCCEASKYVRAIIFTQTGWYLKLSSSVFSSLYSRNREDSKVYNPKFCPYCNTPLPEMELDPDFKDPVSKSKDGYYCDTCKERLNNCICLAPMAGYKPKGI